MVRLLHFSVTGLALHILPPRELKAVPLHERGFTQGFEHVLDRDARWRLFWFPWHSVGCCNHGRAPAWG